MYQTGRSERCIYNVPISGALDSRLQVKQASSLQDRTIYPLQYRIIYTLKNITMYSLKYKT